jgi:hypothetical protein
MIRHFLAGLAVSAALIGSAAADAGPAAPGPRVGDSYMLVMVRESASQTSDSGSSSTYDKDGLVERVTGVRADGLELEYNLPDGSGDASSQWQLPARIFRPFHGAPQLLNRAELEARRDRWLKKAKLTNAACGRLIFTWNAFRIECDPETAIQIVEAFDLESDIGDGAPYRDKAARAPGKLVSTGASTFAAELEVDPDFVHRQMAQVDVALGELMRKPVTLEAALGKRSKERVSGTISVSLETGADGKVRRRTRVTKVTTVGVDGVSETRTETQTLERLPLPAPGQEPVAFPSSPRA